MEVKLLNHQYDFLLSERNTLLVAGYGSGKSYAGTIKTIYKKLQYPDKKVAYYLPTYGLVRDIAFDKFPTILEEMGIQYKLNKSDKEIHIENAGAIIFRTMDSPETIVGYETAYALIDEADILPSDKMSKVYQKILSRNRAVEISNVDAVSTPEGFRWLYNQSKSGHFEVIHAKTYDNKHLSKDYIETLKDQYPENLLEAYLNGRFVNLTSGTVYSYFKRNIHESKEVIKDRETLYVGQDFNIDACVSIVLVQRGEYVHAVDEILSYDTKAVIRNLKEKYPEHRIEIYPDASGDNRKTSASETDIEMLKQAGFSVYVNSSNPTVKDRVNLVNNMFDKNRLFVNTYRCPQLTNSLEQQAYNDKGEPEKFNTHPASDDYNDALGYFIAYKFPLRSYTKVSGGFQR